MVKKGMKNVNRARGKGNFALESTASQEWGYNVITSCYYKLTPAQHMNYRHTTLKDILG